jgi:hypothetical protein
LINPKSCLTRPADRSLDKENMIRSLDKENMIDAYYRVQLSPEIEIGPTLEITFDPVRNPDDDTVYVCGFRTRRFLYEENALWG